MTNAQQWLDKEYPSGERNNINWLSFSYKNLTGELVLTNWANLEEISLQDSEITSLTIINCPKLKQINARNSHLTKLEGLPVSLIGLNLNSNQLSGDLEMFSHLVNLESLSIGNWDEDKIKQGIYNQFVGSLQPLQNCPKLLYLDISNTDLNAGVEYLPSSFIGICCYAELRPNCQLTKIVDKLEQFKKIEGKDAREKWKREQQSKSIQYTSQIEWIKK